ncbi:hypothetical protein KKH27_10535 [bacterium]|nr:hypothetical protein [bacterium]MBU1982903.1 hypothetical protein [bacterium]
MTGIAPESSPTPPRRRVVLNTVFSILAKLQSGVFSYLSTLLLLRALKVEEYGLWSLLFIATTANLALVARLGLGSSVRRFVPEYFARSQYRTIARLFHASNLVQAAASLLLVTVALVFAEPIAAWMKFPQSANLLRIFAVGAFAFLLSENIRMMMGGLFMQRTVFVVHSIYSALRLAGIFIATRFDNPFTAVIVAEGILYALQLGFYFIAYHRLVQPHVLSDKGPSERPPWKRFTRFTALSYLNELGAMLLNSATDLFLVTGYLGAWVVGLYGLANRVFGIINNLLPNAFLADVITPLFYSEYGAAPEKSRFGFTLLMKTSLLVTIPIGLWLALMAEPVIVHFFDARYAEAAAIVVIMGLFLPIETVRYPLGLMLQNAERNDLLIYAKVFGVVKILTGIWLLPHGTLTTMVWITFLSVAGQNLLLYYWIVTKLHSPTDHLGLLRLLINGLVCGAIFYLIRPWFSGPVGVIASVLVFAALWLGISTLHRVFRPEERDFINSKLPHPLWRF